MGAQLAVTAGKKGRHPFNIGVQGVRVQQQCGRINGTEGRAKRGFSHNSGRLHEHHVWLALDSKRVDVLAEIIRNPA
jgi:hypothetical protein